jgi:ribosome recycling factor
MDEISKKAVAELKQKLDKTIQHLTDQLRTIRTGRAAPALVDTIKVDYYGTPTALNQLAHVSVPEPRQLMVKPFDVSAIKEIERAILKSDLGLTPSSDGKVLRLTLPPLSEEQRKKLVHKVKELAETARVALRNTRRDAKKHADQVERDAHVSEDVTRHLVDEIQKQLKAAETKVEELLKKKTDEIMEE